MGSLREGFLSDVEESRWKVEVWQFCHRLLQQASPIEDLKTQLKHARRSSDRISKRKGNECKIRHAKLEQCQLKLREAREENERLKSKEVVGGYGEYEKVTAMSFLGDLIQAWPPLKAFC